MDSASEVDLESDASSVDGSLSLRESSAKNEQLQRRVDSLTQENRVLKKELETMKLKLKNLQEVNQQLRRDSVSIQAKAEQEEEFISNTLLKKITELKKEKESLALNYEQEEECLTNELSRKFTQLRQEKVALEKTLAREQENQVNKLKRRIEKLEGDMNNKQDCLERLRWEKIELENALEQEQEALVNRLWKKMEKLETEKRMLQEKLESASAPLSGSSSALNLSNVSHQDAPTQASCIVSSQFSRAAPSGSISGGDHPVYISLTSGQASPTSPGTSCQNSVSNTTPVRPTSSGPGSQGGSLRRHHHSHGQQQFPQQSQSGTVSSNRLSLLINPVSTSDGSGYSVAIPSGPVSALSNVTTSRSMTHSSIPLDAGGPNAEVAETMSLRSASCKIGAISAPPQSPMELDTAG
ncbi:unnamed protein product [Protopolystoma xenopodis]|uniref:Coiled-coil domain-containing protein 6 n=1 Tax=Protopolystoma xenopodis TaxID=117903 RepID=A0A448WG19_9PLAT|nr:unnamed protein product [Protopolystoma xenopodis]